jgi:hypothetical protein
MLLIHSDLNQALRFTYQFSKIPIPILNKDRKVAFAVLFLFQWERFLNSAQQLTFLHGHQKQQKVHMKDRLQPYRCENKYPPYLA